MQIARASAFKRCTGNAYKTRFSQAKFWCEPALSSECRCLAEKVPPGVWGPPCAAQAQRLLSTNNYGAAENSRS